MREDGGLTLIDASLPGSATTILNAPRRLDLPIRRIVLTHALGDHIGSLDALHRQLPEAEVLVCARDARFLAGDMRLDPSESQVNWKSIRRDDISKGGRYIVSFPDPKDAAVLSDFSYGPNLECRLLNSMIIWPHGSWGQ